MLDHTPCVHVPRNARREFYLLRSTRPWYFLPSEVPILEGFRATRSRNPR
jgi:hypothetical protein